MSNQTKVDVSAKLAAMTLASVRGVGPRIYQQLSDHFGGPVSVLKATASELRQVPGVGRLAESIVSARDLADAQQLLEFCGQQKIQVVLRDEDTYPQMLREITDPPNLLYVQGTIEPVDNLAIAVVGSRHATHYGKRQAESLGRALGMAGITVVSGLARGIDAAAHRGALKAGGRTIAVLGSGLLNLYPAEHQDLAAQISAQGAVITECHPQQAPKSGSFPKRNRIISGLCLGTVVVEAAQRSGALISARLAMEQNREVFAVPGPVSSRMSRGCHQLIRDGAKLVESVEDILEELGPLSIPTELPSRETIRHPAELKLSEQETQILQAIQMEPTSLDDVVNRSGLPVQRVLSTVSVLEMRRLVKRLNGTTVVRS